jgi:nitroimidazol reductase NimA-like FMN-containing flavoprotein (pyridoxamine 5'-phosphate oxidase superfamily)
MKRPASSPPVDLSRVRRRNRQVTDESWIRDFLSRAPMCTVATVHKEQPFLNANLFVYDGDAHVLYFHTAGEGRTRSNIEANGRVCVSVSEMGRLLPAERVTDYSAEYASVTLFGTARIVTDPAEARSVLQRQLQKYFPHKQSGRDYQPFTDPEMSRATIYRVEIEEWSAKRHQEAEDFPGAFWYRETQDVEGDG